MSGMLGNVIQDPYFIISEHSIKYRCVVVLRKQQETGCHLLLLVYFWQYVGGTHLLNLYVFPMQCKWGLTVSSESWKCSSSSPQVWLLSSSMVTFRSSSSRFCGWPLWDSSQRGRTLDLNFWNQCLVVCLLTTLSSKAWHI